VEERGGVAGFQLRERSWLEESLATRMIDFCVK